MSTVQNTYTGDATQTSFLSALAYGETGTQGSTYTGYGFADESGAPLDQYGAPIYDVTTAQGTPTSAAGPFQFERGTWDSLASQLGLTFGNSTDQQEGAWDLAATTYSNATGGQSLEQAFADGDYSSISSALAGTWPSITNLASNVSAGNSGNIGSGGAGSGGSAASGTSSTGVLGEVTALFQRGGLIIVGGIILAIALWALLSHYTDVPSPTQTAQEAGKAVMA